MAEGCARASPIAHLAAMPAFLHPCTLRVLIGPSTCAPPHAPRLRSGCAAQTGQPGDGCVSWELGACCAASGQHCSAAAPSKPAAAPPPPCWPCVQAPKPVKASPCLPMLLTPALAVQQVWGSLVRSACSLGDAAVLCCAVYPAPIPATPSNSALPAVWTLLPALHLSDSHHSTTS